VTRHGNPVSVADGRIAPWAIADPSFRERRRNPSTTGIVEIPHRGHSPVHDNGRREVANHVQAVRPEHH
jgi:non-heme chloroperoxidase